MNFDPASFTRLNFSCDPISGNEPNTYGSMMELTWRGERPITMNDGTERKFINDYDTVIMKAWCEKDGVRIGFGEVRNKIYPALK